jgi:hypothetical protein
LYNSCLLIPGYLRAGRASLNKDGVLVCQNATLVISYRSARAPKVFSFYIPALAALASVGVRRASTAWLKYIRYDRWMPYMTGKTTKAACQPK